MFPCIEALFLPGLRGYVTDATGRALEWHSRGQRFDPAYLHQPNTAESPENTTFSGLFFILFSGGSGLLWRVKQWSVTLIVTLMPKFYKTSVILRRSASRTSDIVHIGHADDRGASHLIQLFISIFLSSSALRAIFC